MSRYIDADKIDWSIVEDEHGKRSDAIVDCEILIENQTSIDLVRCSECRWSRPRTLKGETGYRCLFYRVDKAESGYCDIGEREGE